MRPYQKWFLFLVFIALPFGLPDKSFSEPTPSVNYLMNRPLSYFDWGLYRLGEYVKQFVKREPGEENFYVIDGKEPYVYVGYDWDANRIIITISYRRYRWSEMLLDNEKLKELEQADVEKYKWPIVRLISDLKSSLGINFTKPDYIDGFTPTLYHLFSPTGYKFENEPENLKKELYNIVKIRARISFKETHIETEVGMFERPSEIAWDIKTQD